MKILITAIGKRVQLVRNLKIKGINIIGVDCEDLIATKNIVDKFYLTPKVNKDNYVNELFKICKEEKIDFLIPLYEKEFLILCDNKELFKNNGITLILSSKEIINICNDKKSTYKFLKKYNIRTPEVIGDYSEKIKFPLIIKPSDGMGSTSVFKINNLKEFKFFKDYVNKPIIQEFIEGTEYTIDALCDLDGNTISIVPRERIKVRSGEVEKSKTIKDEAIINKCKNLIECLKKEGSVIGPLTIQCFKTYDNEVIFIEINPRFGGGVPLSFEAGINYGEVFKKIFRKENIEYINDFKEITMIRYDEAIFVED